MRWDPERANIVNGAVQGSRQRTHTADSAERSDIIRTPSVMSMMEIAVVALVPSSTLVQGLNTG